MIGAGCTSIPVDQCYIGANVNLVLNQSTYYFNGSANGIMTFTGSNITLDCNGSVFIGNSTQGSTNNIGLRFFNNNIQNINVYNCTFINYAVSIRFSQNCSNVYLKNINITNTQSGVLAYPPNKYYSNITFDQSYFSNTSSMLFDIGNQYDFIIKNSYFKDTSRLFIYGENKQNINISIINNIFNNSGYTDSFSYQVRFDNVSTLLIQNNTFLNASGNGAIMLAQSANITIDRNIFDYNDRAIGTSYYDDTITISNNLFNNSLVNRDGAETPIWIYGNRNVSKSSWIQNLYIINNTFNNFGCQGMNLRNVHNGYISNNSFNQDLSYILNYNFDCISDPLTAIGITETFKGFVISPAYWDDNYTDTINLSSNNITILNNNFGNLNVFLRTQGTTNLTHDLSNYYVKSFWNYASNDKDTFYISNNWNNLTLISNKVLLNTIFSGASHNFDFNITLNKVGYDYYKNVYKFIQNRTLGLFNLSSAFLYFSNTSSLSNVNGDINISLNPNDYVYVYSDGNCPVGMFYIGSGTCSTISKYQQVTSCSSSVNAFLSYIGLIGLIGIIVLIGWLIAYLAGFIDKTKFADYSIITSVVIILVVSFAVIVGIILIQAVCTLF